MSMKKILCLVLVLVLCGAMAFAETDVQAQLDDANARIAELEALVELYKPFYDAQVVIEYDGGVIEEELLFGAVMSVTNSLAVADVTVALNGFPSTNYATHTIINHLNDYGIIRLEMGYACSIAVLLFFLMLTINKAVQRMLEKVGT